MWKKTDKADKEKVKPVPLASIKPKPGTVPVKVYQEDLKKKK